MTDSRGDRRRAELIQAGMECLVRDGWAGLTHRRVAEQAQAAPGLVRYHFGTLSGLRAAIARQASDDLILPVTEQLGTTSTFDELVEQVVALMGSAEDRGTRLLTQIIVGTAHYEEVAEIVDADVERARDGLARHLVQLGSGWSPEQARDAASLLLATVDGILLHGLVAAKPPAAEQLRRAVRAILSAEG